MTNDKPICAECVHWRMGDTWGTNLTGRDHGVLVESKGWCVAKPNKRKRWNYQPASKCNLLELREKNTLIMSGQGLPTKEQIDTIMDFLDEKFGKE